MVLRMAKFAYNEWNVSELFDYLLRVNPVGQKCINTKVLKFTIFGCWKVQRTKT